LSANVRGLTEVAVGRKSNPNCVGTQLQQTHTQPYVTFDSSDIWRTRISQSTPQADWSLAAVIAGAEFCPHPLQIAPSRGGFWAPPNTQLLDYISRTASQSARPFCGPHGSDRQRDTQRKTRTHDAASEAARRAGPSATLTADISILLAAIIYALQCRSGLLVSPSDCGVRGPRFE